MPLVVACAAPTPVPTTTPATVPPTEEVYHWRLQHSFSAAEGHFFDNFSEIVESMSGGRIDISVFSDGELVPLNDLPEATAMGTLDMCFFHPVQQEGAIPACAVEGYPFLWNTADEFLAIHYQMGLEEAYRELFKNTWGIHLIGVLPDDTGTFLWTEDFSCLADLKGRTSNALAVIAEILQGYGVSSTAVDPSDLYTSLATGLLDGVAFGGAKCMYDMGFCEVAKYLMTPYYKLVWSPAYSINMNTWESLPADLQSILTHATRSNGIYMRSFYADQEKRAIAVATEEFGLKVVTLPDSDVKALVTETRKHLDLLKTESPDSAKVVEIIEGALELYYPGT